MKLHFVQTSASVRSPARLAPPSSSLAAGLSSMIIRRRAKRVAGYHSSLPQSGQGTEEFLEPYPLTVGLSSRGDQGPRERFIAVE
jgi:hypothetical protein